VCKIKKAELKDIAGIMESYNKEIKEGVATFDTKEKTFEEMKKWFGEHGPKNPIMTAEINNELVGWASLSKYDDKKAYSDTAEISLYVKKELQNKGIGKRLMKRILDEGKRAGLHTVIARITNGNQISVKLHKKFGFEYVGIYREVGKKFGKTLDVHLMQKIFRN